MEWLDKHTKWLSGKRTKLMAIFIGVIQAVIILDPMMVSEVIGLSSRGQATLTLVFAALVPVFYSMKKGD